MKTIILLRHGRAQKRNKLNPDMERTLTPRGMMELEKTFIKVKEYYGKKIMILSCPSQRTRGTAEAIKETLTSNVKPMYLSSFYSCSINEFRDELREHAEDDVDTIIAIGHNPILSEIAGAACGAEIVLKTSDAAVLTQEDISWPEIDFHGEWHLEALVT